MALAANKARVGKQKPQLDRNKVAATGDCEIGEARGVLDIGLKPDARHAIPSACGPRSCPAPGPGGWLAAKGDGDAMKGATRLLEHEIVHRSLLEHGLPIATDQDPAVDTETGL